MSFIMVDVETDGQIPGDYSMIEIGAVIVEPPLSKTFHGFLRPIDGAKWDPEALLMSHNTREGVLKFAEPKGTMESFEGWLAENSIGKRPMFVSDNNGFDFMFVSWYFWHFLNRNPFGHSSTNLGSLYKGLVGTMHKNFKHLRKTKHTHNPVDDAMGNAEALLHMKACMGLDIVLE